ncbi:MAG: CMP deaminase [Candidatus Sabulitectum sp.]|nr:CMP deaminase [Candidatus Sabulitectum sp.]
MRKWDLRFLQMCKLISTWSKDPSTKCGSVIVRPDNTVVSLGYNGFPRNIEDTAKRLADREEKYKLTVHSELNAILNAAEKLDGYTLYAFPFAPCVRCTPHIIQAGITRVVTIKASDDIMERWSQDIEMTKKLLGEAGMVFVEYIVE